MAKKIQEFEKQFIKKDLPKCDIGDTVQVYVKIKEEGKTRIQIFKGVVMRKKGTGVRATVTVRRISYGEGVERTFTLHSPFVDKIAVKKKGSVNRAKLYYLRKRKGKKSKVEEKIESEKVSGPETTLREEGA